VKTSLHHLQLQLAGMAVTLLWCAPVQVVAQDALEFAELKAQLDVAYERIQNLTEQLRVASSSPSGALTASTVSANAEASEFKERYLQVRGILEALGISALETGGDEKADRLVAALGDLRLMAEERQRLAGALANLVAASEEFGAAAIPGNPESAMHFGEAIQQAARALAESPATADEVRPKDLTSATVISVKPEMGVIVLNVGARDGVKPGMHFHVHRDELPIGTVLVTEVRRGISGAVISNLSSPQHPPQIDDAARAAAGNSL
jgi:hypothetical protein